MADSLHIDLGVIRLLINEGPEYIEFNPTDNSFVEKFYALSRAFKVKQVEFTLRANELEVEAAANKSEDEIPVNFEDSIMLINNLCTFIRDQIDEVFGAGTSQTVFGTVMSLESLLQFFTGVGPYIESARKTQVEPYLTPLEGTPTVMK